MTTPFARCWRSMPWCLRRANSLCAIVCRLGIYVPWTQQTALRYVSSTGSGEDEHCFPTARCTRLSWSRLVSRRQKHLLLVPWTATRRRILQRRCTNCKKRWASDELLRIGFGVRRENTDSGGMRQLIPVRISCCYCWTSNARHWEN